MVMALSIRGDLAIWLRMASLTQLSELFYWNNFELQY